MDMTHILHPGPFWFWFPKTVTWVSIVGPTQEQEWLDRIAISIEVRRSSVDRVSIE